MPRLLLALPLLVALLAACGSGVVPAGSGTLRATATAPTGTYAFACDPAAQGGSGVVIADDMQFSCPSEDGRATLTVLIRTVTSTGQDGRTTEEHLASAVLTVATPSAAAYAGSATLSQYSRLLNRDVSGTFTAALFGPAQVTGSFSFHAP